MTGAQLSLEFDPAETRECAWCGHRYLYDEACWPDHCRDWCRMQALGLAPEHDGPDAHREFITSGEHDRQLAAMLRDMPAARAERVLEGAAWWLS